jgi:hypothetical protein
MQYNVYDFGGYPILLAIKRGTLPSTSFQVMSWHRNVDAHAAHVTSAAFAQVGSAQVCSCLLTLLMHLIRNRKLLARGLKGTPSAQLEVRILSPLYVPRVIPVCLPLRNMQKYKNAHIQGHLLRLTSACFTPSYILSTTGI